MPKQVFATALYDDMADVGTSLRGKGWVARVNQTSVGREVLIEARTQQTAERALDLMWAVRAVRNACLSTFDRPELSLVQCESASLPEFTVEHPAQLSRCSTHLPGVWDDVALAALASRRRDWVYAAQLISFSMMTHSNEWSTLDPRNFPHPQRSPYPRDHIRYAYAIVSAYAAIEQLGLEVRSSNKEPAFKDKAWNPVQLESLRQRLTEVGVPPDSTMLWYLRGATSRLHRDMPPSILEMQEWSSGCVRDSEVRVVDAIAYARWFRNQVSAHKLRKHVTSLSIYDVANMQLIARRLLLGVLRNWPKD